MKTAEIARFPDGNGFLLNPLWGKTLRDNASNLFGLRGTLAPPFVLLDP